MSFLIPTARPNPSGAAPFGRLLHWCGLALAVVLLWAAWMAWGRQPEPITLAHPYPSQGLPADFVLVLAAIVALIGRGLRYLFAGE